MTAKLQIFTAKFGISAFRGAAKFHLFYLRKIFASDINDLQNCSDLGKFVIFADNTNIFVYDNNREEVVKKGNSVLTAVSSYMHANKLHINMKKCCYMHFKPKISTSN